MDSVKNTVSYCCVWKNSRMLYTYNSGGHEMESLAALCLEMAPPYHRWYFQTMGKKTFGFLMDDGYIYFAIANESVGNSQVLRFLHKLRDEFRNIGKRGPSTSLSNLNSLCLQDQLLPIVHSLVASLENVSGMQEWPRDKGGGELMPSPCNTANGLVEANSTSTKAPLLGKISKHEKKKMKEHAIAMKDIEMEHRRSTDRGANIDLELLDTNSQGTSASSPLPKEYSSGRIRATSQNLRKKWCRQVRIILAVDAAVCAVLLIIWLIICRGIECIR